MECLIPSLIRKTWPLPNIDICLDSVGGAKCITVIDVMSTYWQISVAEKDTAKTAFIMGRAKYVFRLLPLGVLCAPWIFRHTMAMALSHKGPDNITLCYINDLKSLERTFAALQAAGSTLEPSKIRFGPKQVSYLGHIISADGISVDQEHIQAINDLPTPTCIKDLHSGPGVMNFVRQFIKDHADITAPVVDLIRKE
ncbi:unnamed protein product, partial [Sphacelaria rigidula]